MARHALRPVGGSGIDALRPIADYSTYLYGDSRSRCLRGGSGARHGAHRIAATVSGGVAAGGKCDSFRGAGGHSHLRRSGDHCGGHWSRRAGRIYFPWVGHGRQPSHFSRGHSGGNPGAAGGFRRGLAGEASTATMKRLCTFAVAAALLVSSCTPSHPDRIVVGSKNFTESFLLGEIIAQQIEAHTNLKVD